MIGLKQIKWVFSVSVNLSVKGSKEDYSDTPYSFFYLNCKEKSKRLWKLIKYLKLTFLRKFLVALTFLIYLGVFPYSTSPVTVTKTPLLPTLLFPYYDADTFEFIPEGGTAIYQ